MNPTVIRIEDAHKVYNTGEVEVHALRGVSFEVKKGEFVAVMGPSGSGKSTMMNIIGCLDRVTNGSYLLDGIDVATLSKDQLADIRNQKIGFVFQSFNLISRTSVLDNVMLPMVYAGLPVPERQRRARLALASVGLRRRSAACPTSFPAASSSAWHWPARWRTSRR